MRVLVVASLLAVCQAGLLSPLTDCDQTCDDKYEGQQQAACLRGCSLREQLFGCESECVKGGVEEEGEAEACRSGCAVPYQRSVMMTVDMTGAGKPMVRVVSVDAAGKRTEEEREAADGEMEKMFGGAPAFNPFFSLRNFGDDDEDKNELLGDDGVFTDLRDVHRMMEQLMRDMARDMQASRFGNAARPSGHALLAQQQGESVGNSLADGSPILHTASSYSQRPSGHEGMRGGSLVGNSLPDGQPIINVQPVDKEGEEEGVEKESVQDEETHVPRSRPSGHDPMLTGQPVGRLTGPGGEPLVRVYPVNNDRLAGGGGDGEDVLWLRRHPAELAHEELQSRRIVHESIMPHIVMMYSLMLLAMAVMMGSSCYVWRLYCGRRYAHVNKDVENNNSKWQSVSPTSGLPPPAYDQLSIHKVQIH